MSKELSAIRRAVSDRMSSWGEIFYGKAVLLFTGLWAMLGAWDLFKSELLPGKYQSWTLISKTPHLHWYVWVLVLQMILLLLLLEGAHAAIKKHNTANLELQAQIEKADDFPKTTLSRDWPGDWKLAEDGFRRYEESSVRADWSYTTEGQFKYWRVTGDLGSPVNDCRALCLQAGKLLLVSPTRHGLPDELISENDDVNRWLDFLKERYGLEQQLIGESVSEGKRYHTIGGCIHKLAATSASACVECGAMSFQTAL